MTSPNLLLHKNNKNTGKMAKTNIFIQSQVNSPKSFKNSRIIYGRKQINIGKNSETCNDLTGRLPVTLFNITIALGTHSLDSTVACAFQNSIREEGWSSRKPHPRKLLLFDLSVSFLDTPILTSPDGGFSHSVSKNSLSPGMSLFCFVFWKTTSNHLLTLQPPEVFQLGDTKSHPKIQKEALE